MNNEHHQQYLARQSWLNCIGDLVQQNNDSSEDENQFKENLVIIENENSQQKSSSLYSEMTTDTQLNSNENSEFFQSKRQRSEIYSEEEHSSDRFCSQQSQPKQQDQDKNLQEKSQRKDIKVVKQSGYSKSYRQRKKQHQKVLQQQNHFLKQKINELQFRLRQKQLQINRLKYPPMEKDCSVEQLNQQFLKKANLILQKTPQLYTQSVYTPSDNFYHEFVKEYSKHGFGGSRKKNILNYFFNELLEAIFKDSQKYLFLICNQSKNYEQMKGLQSYEQIDAKFLQIMQLDQDKIMRMNYFSKNLHHFMIQLKNDCAQMYGGYKKILETIDKAHNFMKEAYLTNMDFGRKRIGFENWFDGQKHSKLMRRLRSDWLQFIKLSAERDPQQQKKNTKGNKKKKQQSKQFTNNNKNSFLV